MMKKISIVMCTYNGEQYVIEQLDSILNQSIKPDEVVIMDDASTDGTCAIIQDYISSHSLVNWHLYCNEKNKGWVRNFYDGSRIASGDYIFFSDQDDVWYLNKIEKMVSLMEKREIGCLICGNDTIDGDGNTIVDFKSNTHRTQKLSRFPLDVKSFQIVYMGCCMAIAREVVDAYIRIGYKIGAHDINCSRIAVALSSCYFLDEALIKHRLHENNATRKANYISTIGTQELSVWVKSINDNIIFLNNLDQNLILNESAKASVAEAIDFFSTRKKYLVGECLFFELIPNVRKYIKKNMILKDFAYRHNLQRILGRIYAFLLNLFKSK